MQDRRCLECDIELEETYIGRYECKQCNATYYESDFVENEGGLNVAENKEKTVKAIEKEYLTDNHYLCGKCQALLNKNRYIDFNYCPCCGVRIEWPV